MAEVVSSVKEEYQRKFLDRITDRIVDILVLVISAFSKGWRERNRSRIAEWRLMFYALNRSPTGVIGMLIVVSFILMGIFGRF